MILGVVIQQPVEVLDWDVLYEDWLGIDTLDYVVVTVIPATGTLSVTHQIVTDQESNPDMVKLWIQGGSDGEEYTVEINAQSVAGRTKQDELIVQIEDFK